MDKQKGFQFEFQWSTSGASGTETIWLDYDYHVFVSNACFDRIIEKMPNATDLEIYNIRRVK